MGFNWNTSVFRLCVVHGGERPCSFSTEVIIFCWHIRPIITTLTLIIKFQSLWLISLFFFSASPAPVLLLVFIKSTNLSSVLRVLFIFTYVIIWVIDLLYGYWLLHQSIGFLFWFVSFEGCNFIPDMRKCISHSAVILRFVIFSVFPCDPFIALRKFPQSRFPV